MKFGLFDWIEHRPQPLNQTFEDRLQLLEAADQAGFYCYHLAEHHFEPLSRAPSPALFLASAAQRTKRLRLGPLCLLLPMYHPLRLIEEVCMLDNLSGGRLELGVGRGVSPPELQLYGVEPERSRDIFEEALSVMVRGFTSETLTFKGEFFNFDGVPMELKPLQKPYPPLWYPTSTPESVPRAGARGLNVVVAGPNQYVREHARRHREAWEEHRGDPGRLNPGATTPVIAVNRQVFVADTEREAIEVGRAAHATWWSNITTLFRKYGMTPPGLGGLDDFDRVNRAGGFMIGSPSTVREQVDKFAFETGIDYLICAFQWGSITHAQAMRSMRLFSAEIMPQAASA